MLAKLRRFDLHDAAELAFCLLIGLVVPASILLVFLILVLPMLTAVGLVDDPLFYGKYATKTAIGALPVSMAAAIYYYIRNRLSGNCPHGDAP
jgi:hypothetical protein